MWLLILLKEKIIEDCYCLIVTGSWKKLYPIIRSHVILNNVTIIITQQTINLCFTQAIENNYV